MKSVLERVQQCEEERIAERDAAAKRSEDQREEDWEANEKYKKYNEENNRIISVVEDFAAKFDERLENVHVERELEVRFLREERKAEVDALREERTVEVKELRNEEKELR